MAQNSPTRIYLIVSQFLYLIAVLTIGGYFLGYYLANKNVVIGGICATIGAICGIILFVLQLLRIGKENEKQQENIR